MYNYCLEYHMKLTKEHQREIENIIKKEMLTMKKGWVQSDTSKRHSMIIEKRLFEADQSLDSIATSLKDVPVDLEDTGVNAASSATQSYDKELYEHILSLLQSRNIVASNMTSDDLIEEMMEYDSGTLQEAQMKAISDIAGVLADYAQNIGSIVIGAFSSNDEMNDV